jgi:hypothetical protein
MLLVNRKAFRCVSASLVLMLSVFGIASIAQAVTFSMTGDMQLFQPSVGFTNPSREKILPSPNRGSATVSQTGFATGSTPPATLMIGAGVWQLDGWPNQTAGGAPAPGTKFRSFPALPSFAQVSTTFVTTHGPVSFMAGAGAGPVDWCPYNAACLNYALGSQYPIRLSVTPGAQQFGGTFKLLQNGGALVWAVPGYANPTNTILQIPNPPGPWGAGSTNYLQVTDTRMSAFVYVNGSNSVGTNTNPGPNGRIINPGTLQGPLVTPTNMTVVIDLPDYINTAFQMTTGMMRFSDMTPGSPEVNTISGSDTRTPAGNGNITLVGGSMVHGGSSGNLFFNATRLHMSLPEPGYAFGLAAGISILCGLQVLRRRS